MTLRPRFAAPALVAASLLAAGAVGAPTLAATKKAAPTVSIKNFAFAPAKVSGTVKQTLTVTNNDTTAHTFTGGDGAFDLGTIQPGKSATLPLTKKGTFTFRCNFHPSMKGTLKVT